MPIRSILVAVDFGEASARAVAVGGALAARCRDTSLRLLHAESIEAPAYFTSEQIADLERQRHTITSQAEQFLSRFGRQHTAVPFIPAIDRRLPSEAIVAAAASADLVVMGTHGRHGLQRWWLGSVAERVLRETPTPLLVVRAPDVGHVPTQTPDHLFDRIVVHAAAPVPGNRVLAVTRVLAACFEGVVSDERQGVLGPALEHTRATLLAASVPEPRSAAWTSNYGEPLLRYCAVPILFVPELREGASL